MSGLCFILLCFFINAIFFLQGETLIKYYLTLHYLTQSYSQSAIKHVYLNISKYDDATTYMFIYWFNMEPKMLFCCCFFSLFMSFLTHSLLSSNSITANVLWKWHKNNVLCIVYSPKGSRSPPSSLQRCRASYQFRCTSGSTWAQSSSTKK